VITGYVSPWLLLFAVFSLVGHGVLVGNPNSYAQSVNSTIPSNNAGVKITYPKANSTIPVGILTINGTSSDTTQTDCKVFVDWNDLKPMQNVTPAGINGTNDYSSWKFTYNQTYHNITQGPNELTSKIICINNPSGNSTTKFYSINVTGTLSNTSSSPSSSSSSTSPPAVPASLNDSEGNSSAYHTISYQGILPQYNRPMTSDDHANTVEEESSKRKDDKTTVYQESNTVTGIGENAGEVDTPIENADEEDSTTIVDTPIENADEEDSTTIENPIYDKELTDLSTIHITNPDLEKDLNEEAPVLANRDFGNDRAIDSKNINQPEKISAFYKNVEDSIHSIINKDHNSDLKPIKDIVLKDQKFKKEGEFKKKNKNFDAKEKKFQKKSNLKKPSMLIEVVDPFKAK
jgi:hypothetical protein